MQLKIDSGIPVPKKVSPATAAIEGAAFSMKAGDSVLTDEKTSRKLLAAIKRLGAKAERRQEGEEWRVWKLAGDRPANDEKDGE